MHAVVQLATQVARADVPVLITGPNGAGKEKIAEIIQANSRVRRRPVRARQRRRAAGRAARERAVRRRGGRVHRRAKARDGRFEAADGGTLFLDEIGNLLAGRAGEAAARAADRRVRAARLEPDAARERADRSPRPTRRSPDAIREGRFREDLYYRLNVIELQVPPLAERRDDILPLARHFLEPGYELAAGRRARCCCATTGPATCASCANCMRRACLLAGRPRDPARRTSCCRSAHGGSPKRGRPRARSRRDRARAHARRGRGRHARRASSGLSAPVAVPAHGEARHRARTSRDGR